MDSKLKTHHAIETNSQVLKNKKGVIRSGILKILCNLFKELKDKIGKFLWELETNKKNTLKFCGKNN